MVWMMTDQPEQEPAPPVANTARHEEMYHLKQDDINDVAFLTALVGKELTTIDQYGSGMGTKKATKLSKQKIFNQRPLGQTPAATPATPPPATIDSKLENLKQTVVTQNAPPPAVQAPSPVVADPNIIDRINRMEQKIDQVISLHKDILSKLTENTKQLTLSFDD